MNVTLEPFALPLERPLETAGRTIATREGVLACVAGGDTRGWGEATPLPGWTEPHDRCERALASAADTVERGDPEAALESLAAAPAARHGLELALLDRRTSATGTPLYRHLGARQRVASVPINATVSAAGPDATARAVRAIAERGVPCCKLKVGAGSLEADRERLQRVRSVAPDIDLRVDANGAWEPAEAREALEHLREFGVSVLEQPLAPDRLAEHADLRGRGVSIALDESLARAGLEAIRDRRAADAVVVKPMAVGGVDPAAGLARRARDADLEVIVSTTVDGVLGRLGALHVAASLEDPLPAGIATGDRLAADLGPDPVTIRAGRASVPQGGGLGLPAGWRGKA